MVRSAQFRILVLLLALTLLAPPAFAAGSRPFRDGGLLAEGWRVLVSVFPVLEKVFVAEDPDDQALTTESEGDVTLGWDPNG